MSEKYRIPFSDKDRFILELKDSDLLAFGDFMIYGSTDRKGPKKLHREDITQEIYVEKESENGFIATFHVKTGIYHYYYRRADPVLPNEPNFRLKEYELVEMEREELPLKSL